MYICIYLFYYIYIFFFVLCVFLFKLLLKISEKKAQTELADMWTCIFHRFCFGDSPVVRRTFGGSWCWMLLAWASYAWRSGRLRQLSWNDASSGPNLWIFVVGFSLELCRAFPKVFVGAFGSWSDVVASMVRRPCWEEKHMLRTWWNIDGCGWLWPWLNKSIPRKKDMFWTSWFRHVQREWALRSWSWLWTT